MKTLALERPVSEYSEVERDRSQSDLLELLQELAAANLIEVRDEAVA